MFSANLRHLWKYILYHILTTDTKVTKDDITTKAVKIQIQIEKGNSKPKSQNQGEVNGFIIYL